MIRNYYTLLQLSQEFRKLIGYRIDECFIQDKNTVVITFFDGLNFVYLNFIHSSNVDTVYLSKNFKRATHNTKDILDFVTDDTVQYVEVIKNTRIIKFTLMFSAIYLFLNGGEESNIVVASHLDNIYETLKNNEKEPKGKFVLPKNDTVIPNEEQSVLTYLVNTYYFSRDYAKEICKKAKIELYRNVSTLDSNKFEELNKISEKFANKLTKANEYYLFVNNSGHYKFSLMELEGYNLHSKYTTISEAIQKKVIYFTIEKKFSDEYKNIFNFLDKSSRKLKATIDIYKNTKEAEDRLNHYKTCGEILISDINPKNKSGKVYVANDWEGNAIEIPLDERLNIAENANKYFKKAKNTNEELKIREKRLPEIESKYNAIINSLEELSQIKVFKELEKFKNNLKIKTGSKMREDIVPIEEKFKKFDLGDGFILYVGKNAANNDELTMKFAKPNDLWLHARGSSGSHAVLRLSNEQKVPKMILQKAAEITAYYSGARNAKYTPVCYTYKKYVRKPKGANVGAVVISKESVIMAEPKIE